MDKTFNYNQVSYGWTLYYITFRATTTIIW